jgi:hypothetical protein
MVVRPQKSEGPWVALVRAKSDSQLAQQFNRPAAFEGHGDFAHEFPGTHLRIAGGDLNAPIRWPWPGNYNGLTVLLSHYRESNDDTPVEILFKIINDDLAQAGHKTWTPRDFAMIMAEVHDVVDARNEAEAERLVVPSAGRRKTQNTFVVEKISDTIHCGRWRAREILRDGTSKLDQQKALALAFSNDPDRRLPRHWALKNGGSWGSPKRDSFARYVLDCIDQDAFEETAIGAALAILAPRFDEGWLLDANELECLLRTIREQGLPITAETALDLWARYDQWKRRGF